MRIFGDNRKGVKDDMLSSNIQFRLIFMMKSKECSLVNQIYESTVYGIQMESENIQEDKRIPKMRQRAVK